MRFLSEGATAPTLTTLSGPLRTPAELLAARVLLGNPGNIDHPIRWLRNWFGTICECYPGTNVDGSQKTKFFVPVQSLLALESRKCRLRLVPSGTRYTFHPATKQAPSSLQLNASPEPGSLHLLVVPRRRISRLDRRRMQDIFHRVTKSLPSVNLRRT